MKSHPRQSKTSHHLGRTGAHPGGEAETEAAGMNLAAEYAALGSLVAVAAGAAGAAGGAADSG